MSFMDFISSRARLADQGVKDYVESLLDTTQDGITATAGGGQANAFQITKSMSRISTCATIADSVKLPSAKAGSLCFVVNSGATSANVFPATGEQINALGANNAFAVAAGGRSAFFCPVDGRWFAVLSA